MLNRAYSVLSVKSYDDDQRYIRGIATTPAVDRIGDVVEPLGIKFANPMPLLHHHKSDQPIGTVTFEKPTKDGIWFEARLPKINERGSLQDRVDTAWGEIKHGLIRGVSIGFRPTGDNAIEKLKGGGIRFKETEVLELSLVAIPAHQEANIHVIRSIDTAQRAASGHQSLRGADVTPPGVPGHPISLRAPQEGNAMTTIAEQVTKLEAKRQASAARMEAIMQKTLDEERTSDAAEQEEFDRLNAEVEAVDKDLVRLRKIEQAKAYAAKPVIKANTASEGSDARGGVIVKPQPKLEPGILFTRIAKAKVVAKMDNENRFDVAARMYGADSQVVAEMKANEVVAGSNLAGNWAVNLTGTQGSAIADFAPYLRKGMIRGKFGQGNIPSLRNVPFRMPLVSQTGGGAAYWTGEAKPKGLTAFDFARTTLEPLKCANIAVLTEENIRSSNPSSDAVVRDSLRDAIVEAVDLAFIDPSNSGTTNVKPASITNGASSIVSSGDDADDIRLDLRSLFAKFHAANNPPSSGVLIMPTDVAIAVAMMVNPLGQPEFPSMGMSGANAVGTIVGFPVIVSDHLSDVVVLVNASDIYDADEGEVTVDMSREASLEMKSSGFTQDATVGTGASLVSLWQNNLVGLRAEVSLNWKRRRTSAVAYLTSVDWGGEPHTA